VPHIEDAQSCPVFQRLNPSLLHRPFFKNMVSDLTKVQIALGQHRIDIMNDHWKKALKEGCHEIEWAQIDVSSIKKINTK